jgi:hypothetical protein
VAYAIFDTPAIHESPYRDHDWNEAHLMDLTELFDPTWFEPATNYLTEEWETVKPTTR